MKYFTGVVTKFSYPDFKARVSPHYGDNWLVEGYSVLKQELKIGEIVEIIQVGEEYGFFTMSGILDAIVPLTELDKIEAAKTAPAKIMLAWLAHEAGKMVPLYSLGVVTSVAGKNHDSSVDLAMISGVGAEPTKRLTTAGILPSKINEGETMLVLSVGGTEYIVGWWKIKIIEEIMYVIDVFSRGEFSIPNLYNLEMEIEVMNEGEKDVYTEWFLRHNSIGTDDGNSSVKIKVLLDDQRAKDFKFLGWSGDEESMDLDITVPVQGREFIELYADFERKPLVFYFVPQGPIFVAGGNVHHVKAGERLEASLILTGFPRSFGFSIVSPSFSESISVPYSQDQANSMYRHSNNGSAAPISQGGTIAITNTSDSAIYAKILASYLVVQDGTGITLHENWIDEKIHLAKGQSWSFNVPGSPPDHVSGLLAVQAKPYIPVVYVEPAAIWRYGPTNRIDDFFYNEIKYNTSVSDSNSTPEAERTITITYTEEALTF